MTVRHPGVHVHHLGDGADLESVERAQASSLFGIVKKNSILQVDYQRRERRASPSTAIVEGVPRGSADPDATSAIIAA